MSESPHIAVIGLGYVGLPLAVALARHFSVTGFDIAADRIAALGRGEDATGEVTAAALAESAATFSAAAADLTGHDVYIVTVPTPVDGENRPDLGAVLAACDTVGAAMAKGALVVFESTVYPGVTEEVCGPRLAAASGLVQGRDFALGYSPERINPGDREHTVERITKIYAGETPAATALLGRIYGAVTDGNVFQARDIKTAEAAKVIENAQRDINIAFVNEVAMIVDRLGLDMVDVLEAAETKWNFLRFRPGLVGGHCIGVDPYYLAHLAEEVGHAPEVILAGRRINDAMGGYVARQVSAALPRNPGRVLVLGLTFKEDVPDLRNSRVVDIVDALRDAGHAVDVHDPLADPDEARTLYGVDLIGSLDEAAPYDAVIGAVQHGAYKDFTANDLAGLVAPDGMVADIKAMWRDVELPAGVRRWEL